MEKIDKYYHLTELTNISHAITPTLVGGTLKVASFNVLNYFNGDGLGGGFPTSRGATNLNEFIWQRHKIISTIVAMNADIIGLMEIENDGYGVNSAIQDLINGLNDITPVDTNYHFINPDITLGTNILGIDEIKVALIYRIETVTPIGVPATTKSPPFDIRRPPLAQTFQEKTTAEQLTIVVSHFKSKRCKDADGNASGLNIDQGDGQGCWNAERILSANTLTHWLANYPPFINGNILIIGDLNAYANEDPITTIKNAGYTDLVQKFVGAKAYTYVYKSQAGYLDHALANANLTPKITGVIEWHINADEHQNNDPKSAEQLKKLHHVDPIPASDHDPLIIGLDLTKNSPS